MDYLYCRNDMYHEYCKEEMLMYCRDETDYLCYIAHTTQMILTIYTAKMKCIMCKKEMDCVYCREPARSCRKLRCSGSRVYI